jgi:hypothetical protein
MRELLLDSYEEYTFVQPAEANRDLAAIDITLNEAFNKERVSASTVERLLNKYWLKCRRN